MWFLPELCGPGAPSLLCACCVLGRDDMSRVQGPAPGQEEASGRFSTGGVGGGEWLAVLDSAVHLAVGEWGC